VQVLLLPDLKPSLRLAQIQIDERCKPTHSLEQVAHLKEKFEMGHGHANAIVAVFRQKNGL
jgi:hypothetical protein